jgi:aminoglycoside phosphotransferase (APT) family kinase protein
MSGEGSGVERYSGAKPVEEHRRLNETNLRAWMQENVHGYGGDLSVLQFNGGQSNPTYRLDTPGRSYVLRRKPFGKLLPSAHAVDREFRVISALGQQGFPVPEVYAFCNDDAVIGAPFYVMSMVQGRIFWDPTLPGSTRNERRQIFTEKISILADLHRFDPMQIGLGDFGKPGNYFARQVSRWTSQYRASETEHVPEMERLIEWLPRTVPRQERVSIVHGDYRLDNMIFDLAKPKVVAVLDWELATLGDPMADFTYLLMQWALPGLRDADLSGLDIPTMTEAVDLYGKFSQCNLEPDLNWHFAYNLFRMAGIGQGIIARVRDGTAASENPHGNPEARTHLARTAWAFAEKAGA